MSPDEGRRLAEALEVLVDATESIGRTTRSLLEIVRTSMLAVESELETDDEGRADWQAFLAEHPELTPVNPIDLSEADVLKALKKALRGDKRGAVFACDVATVICGPLGPPRDSLRQSQVCRVADRLSNLANAGLVVRLRPRSGGHTANLWTRPGREVDEHVRHGWPGPEGSTNA